MKGGDIMTMISGTSNSQFSYNPDPTISNFQTGINIMTQSGMSTDVLSLLNSPSSDAYSLDGNLASLDQFNQLNELTTSQLQTSEQLQAGTYTSPGSSYTTSTIDLFDPTNPFANDSSTSTDISQTASTLSNVSNGDQFDPTNPFASDPSIALSYDNTFGYIDPSKLIPDLSNSSMTESLNPYLTSNSTPTTGSNLDVSL